MRSLHYRAVSADYSVLRSITLEQDADWANDPAILEFCRYAASITEPVVLEWLYTAEPESSKSDTEPKSHS